MQPIEHTEIGTQLSVETRGLRVRDVDGRADADWDPTKEIPKGYRSGARQDEPDRRSAPGLALGRDRAAVRLDEPLCDREPEPDAA
jgi:hypothetical protein